MSKPATISVVLTRPQALALLRAANEGCADMEARDCDNPGDNKQLLYRALDKLREATYSEAKS